MPKEKSMAPALIAEASRGVLKAAEKKPRAAKPKKQPTAIIQVPNFKAMALLLGGSRWEQTRQANTARVFEA